MEQPTSGRAKNVRVFITGPRFAYPENLALYLERAFRSLGATVAGADLRTGRTWGTSGWHPTLFLVIKGRDIPYDLAPRMKQAHNCTTVLYFPDPLEDHDNEKWVTANRGFYDHIFLACWYPKEVLEKLDAHWLPVAYDPSIHYGPVLESPGSENKVVFVGTDRPGRSWIRDIPDIRIFGNEWDPSIKDIYLEEKMRVYRASKIILNHHYLARGPNHRFFEALASGGGLLLSDTCPGMEELGFQAGRDFVTYGTPEDAYKYIRYWLNDEWDHLAEYNKIRAMGYETVTPHTFQARVEEMLRVIGQYFGG